MFYVPRQSRQVGRGILARENARIPPLLLNALRKHSDLAVGQHTSGAPCERRHQFAGNSICDYLLQVSLSGDRDVYRIGERNRRTVSAILAMACCAVLFVECREIEYLFRTHYFRPWSRVTRSAAAPYESQAANSHHEGTTVYPDFEGTTH